jgi:hypothetical protein
MAIGKRLKWTPIRPAQPVTNDLVIVGIPHFDYIPSPYNRCNGV